MSKSFNGSPPSRSVSSELSCWSAQYPKEGHVHCDGESAHPGKFFRFPHGLRSEEESLMSRLLVSLTLLCTILSVQTSTSYAASSDDRPQSSDTSTGQSVVPVVQWNKNLLALVRTAGAQPA